MAGPRTKDGYTRIANELVESLARTNLNAYEWRVLLCIIRYTYGWNKKEAYISHSSFSRVTGIEPKHVCRAVKTLVSKGLIMVTKEKARCGYAVQEDFDKWVFPEKGLPGRGTPDGGKNIPSSGNSSIPDQGIGIPAKSHADAGPPGPKEIIKDIYKEISLRERLIGEVRKIFPSLSSIPDSILTDKMDYLVYKVGRGEIKPEAVKNPAAYLMSLTVCEAFPSFMEREAKAEQQRAGETEKRRVDEEERLLAIANADFNRKKVRELIDILETGRAGHTKC